VAGGDFSPSFLAGGGAKGVRVRPLLSRILRSSDVTFFWLFFSKVLVIQKKPFLHRFGASWRLGSRVDLRSFNLVSGTVGDCLGGGFGRFILTTYSSPDSF